MRLRLDPGGTPQFFLREKVSAAKACSGLTLLRRASKLPYNRLMLRMSTHHGEDHQLTGSQAGRITYTLESSLDSVNRVEQTAEQLAKKAGMDEDEVFRIAMAVREAAVNAVLHGNSYDPEKRITASFENTGEALVIRISDQGRGLDPETLPDPLAPENLLRGSGRGIFLIRSFMDEVHFKQLHPGTELTLIKHLGTAQTGS
jgi:serine/threonine-protein kinase RsbW